MSANDPKDSRGEDGHALSLASANSMMSSLTALTEYPLTLAAARRHCWLALVSTDLMPRMSSVLLAVLALLVRYAHVAIPVVSSHSFETLLIAFLMLLAGNLFKGF